MRNSSADQIIIETLTKYHSHLTSHQVYEEVHQRLPAINPSTVYRALDRLVSTGKVSVSDMGTGASVFEITGDHLHHHLVCQGCGQITLLENDSIAPLILELEKQYQYKITTNHLVLFGLCQYCQEHPDQIHS
jgi:Fur family transcriptional regulator, ferric uptake regulator